jgi:hypothetical protein
MIMSGAGEEVPAAIPLRITISGCPGRAVRVCGSVGPITPYSQYLKRISK